MDGERFDAMTRGLAAGADRRRVLGGLLGAALGLLGVGGAGATHGSCRHAGAACTRDRQCCSGDCLRNGTCRCARASQCPQATDPCKEAVCTATGRCGFRNTADGTDCDGGTCHGGACVECVESTDCATGICQNNACVCGAKGASGCDTREDCCTVGPAYVFCSPSGVCGGAGAFCAGPGFAGTCASGVCCANACFDVGEVCREGTCSAP